MTIGISSVNDVPETLWLMNTIDPYFETIIWSNCLESVLGYDSKDER